MKYHVDYGKPTKHKNSLVMFCNDAYNQSNIENRLRTVSYLSPKMSGIIWWKNYREMLLVAIETNIHNTMLFERIHSETQKVSGKSQKSFWRGQLTTGQISTFHRNFGAVKFKYLNAVLLFVDFSKDFDSIHRGMMKEILLAYVIPNAALKTHCKLYKTHNQWYNLQLAMNIFWNWCKRPYIFIICLGIILWNSFVTS